MSLKLADVHRIALLARIETTDAQAEQAVGQLNAILAMIEQIGRVDTAGVAPMAHPLDGTQRLRPDVVSEIPERERTMANAAAQQDGLFLVPRVLE